MFMKGQEASIRGAGMVRKFDQCPPIAVQSRQDTREALPAASPHFYRDSDTMLNFLQYHTLIGGKENASFFDKSIGQVAKYQIIWAYRAGGPPTYIEDMCISGPMNYSPDYHNLVGIKMQNTNGFYFKGIWFTAYEAGLWLTDHSGDCFVDESTGEYNFGELLPPLPSNCYEMAVAHPHSSVYCKPVFQARF